MGGGNHAQGRADCSKRMLDPSGNQPFFGLFFTLRIKDDFDDSLYSSGEM